MSDKKKNGIKLSWQHSSDIADIPLKKRTFSCLGSWSPSSLSSRTTHATEFNQKKIEPQNSPTKENKRTSDLCHQNSSTVNDRTSTTVSFFKSKDEPLELSWQHITDIAGIPLKKRPLSFLRPPLSPSSQATNATELNVIKINPSNSPTKDYKPISDLCHQKSFKGDLIGSETTPGVLEFKPKVTEKPEHSFLETVTEKISNKKSAFRRVFGNTELLSLNGSHVLLADGDYNEPVKQEKIDPRYDCVSENTLDADVQCHIVQPELTDKHAQIFAKQSHSDVITMVGNEGKSQAVSANHEECFSGMIVEEGKTENILSKQSQNKKFKLSHSAMVSNMHFSSDAHKKLDLSPVSATPSKITQAETNADGCLPDLSLTMKPESYDMNGNATKVEITNLKIISSTIIMSDSDPCSSVHEHSGSISSKMDSNLSVISNPQDMDYPVKIKAVEERLQPSENTASYLSTLILGTDNKENIRQIDDSLVLKSTVANNDKSCDLRLKMHNADISNGAEQHVKCRYNVPDDIKFKGDLAGTNTTGNVAGEIICQTPRIALHNDEPLKTTVSLGDKLEALTRTSEQNIGISGFNLEATNLHREHTDSLQHLMVRSENNGMDNRSMGSQINLSAKSAKLNTQNTDELHHHFDADGGTQTNLIGKLHDNDIEDGEVRDLHQCFSTNLSFEKENPMEKQGDHCSECICNKFCKDMCLHPRVGVQKSIVPTSKAISEIPGSVITDSPSHHLSKTALSKASSENNITLLEERQGENIEGSGSNLLPKTLPVVSNEQTLLNTVDTENGFRRGNTSYFNSSPRNFPPGRPVDNINEESDSFSRGNKHQGIRGGKYSRSLRVYEKDRNKGGSCRKSDFSFSRGKKERFATFHDNRFYAPRSEQFNGSANLRYSRPRTVHETFFADGVDESIDGPGREARKSRRLSPRQRGHMLVGKQIIDQTIRGPHSNYNRVGNSYIRRGRRDTPPDNRRGSPNISMKPRFRSPPIWSPRRLPDGFDVHPELISCRSSQPLWFHRAGSPIEDGSLPKNMYERRHSSPPFVSRERDGMKGVCNNFQEYGYPKQGRRNTQRNVRRFHLIDPQVNADEEYFEVSHMEGQLRMARDDRMHDQRNFSSGHHRFVHSINHRYNDDRVDDNARNFSYCIEQGPSRPVRFRPEAEEPPQRETLRDEHRVGNRMVDTSRRIRGLQEQEDTYEVDETPGLHVSSALKRKRF